jgi:hypothetical protein
MATTTSSVGLLQACADPRLLGFRVHPRQGLLLHAIAEHGLVVASAGRRFGKSKAAAAAALWNLLLRPDLDKLVGPGERRFAVSVANSQAQARIFVEHAAAIVKGSPSLRRELVDERVNELIFRGDRVLSAFPCSSKSGRGWPISFLSLDEFAHHFDDPGGEGGPQVARRVWSAMTPSVAQFGAEGRIVVTSTPSGDSGLFAELFKKASNGELPDACAFTAATSDNLAVDRGWLAQQELALGPDDFKREYGAEFVAGGASFFAPESVRSCVQPWREADHFHAGDRWTAGFDAGFERDPSALVIVGHPKGEPGKLIVGYTQRWVPPRRTESKTRQETSAWMAQVFDEAAAAVKRYGCSRLVPDSHLGATVKHEFSRRGVNVSEHKILSGPERLLAWRNLRARINMGRILIPDDRQLVAELLRVRTSRDGANLVLPRVGDSHCDLAVALVSAVATLDAHGAGSGTVTPLSPEALGGEVWPESDLSYDERVMF